VFVDNFITSASETYADLCEQFDRTDRAVARVKRYLGEALLGAQGQGQGGEEDPWQSFFQLIAKFADMYKAAMHEITEFKAAEKRLQHKVTAKEIAAARQMRKVVQVASEASAALVKSGTEKQAERSTQMAAKRVSVKKSEDALQQFKDKMMTLRKRNSAAEIEPDSSSDEDDDDDW
jgi:hypothetical protein